MMSKALTVLAECVDVRSGRRFRQGDVFDPAPTVEQASRLAAAGCLPREAIDAAAKAAADVDKKQETKAEKAKAAALAKAKDKAEAAHAAVADAETALAGAADADRDDAQRALSDALAEQAAADAELSELTK